MARQPVVGKAEMGGKGPLLDVISERLVERVRSGHLPQTPLDGGGHASPGIGWRSGKRGEEGRGCGGALRRSVDESARRRDWGVGRGRAGSKSPGRGRRDTTRRLRRALRHAEGAEEGAAYGHVAALADPATMVEAMCSTMNRAGSPINVNFS